jgi:hypothetical protein
VTIIAAIKAKTQTYCDIKKLGEQIEEASAKPDDKTVGGNNLLGAEFMFALAHSRGCVRGKS